jgi:hypothetical protein
MNSLIVVSDWYLKLRSFSSKRRLNQKELPLPTADVYLNLLPSSSTNSYTIERPTPELTLLNLSNSFEKKCKYLPF